MAAFCPFRFQVASHANHHPYRRRGEQPLHRQRQRHALAYRRRFRLFQTLHFGQTRGDGAQNLGFAAQEALARPPKYRDYPPAALAVLADVPEIIIMGGAQIYAQALPLATDLRLTEVRLDIDGDAFFPAFSPAEWQEVERSSHTAAANGIRFDFVHYRRARQAT